MDEEVVPVPIPPAYRSAAERDDGIREQQSIDALGRLRPVFDRAYGTVTAGNASQITDGAAALVLASARRAREAGLPVLGRIRSWGFAGCDKTDRGFRHSGTICTIAELHVDGVIAGFCALEPPR